MASPFEFGTTVSGTHFTNRNFEKKMLRGNLLSNINTVIISPRRWGKSSLVEQVTNQIASEDNNIKIALIDLFSVHTEEDFLSLYARKIVQAATSKTEEWIDTIKSTFKKIIPKVVLNTEVGDISLEFDKNELIKHKEEIINLPETIAKAKGIKIIVCVDEFQNIIQYDHHQSFEKFLRAYWQRHKEVTYCLYGSKRHMISDIFNDSSRAFYRFGDILLLEKIDKSEWIRFINDKFNETNKYITEEACLHISILADCHSWYVQQLSHIAWLMTEKECDKNIVTMAFEHIKKAQIPFFQQQIESLSGTQIELLKAIAYGESQLTSTSVMNSYKVGTPNNVIKNIQKLINMDIVDKHNEQYVFMDPIFINLFKQYVVNK